MYVTKAKTRMLKDSSLFRLVETYRSGFLAAVLVAEMMISPLADYHPRLGALLALSIVLALLAAASFMANQRIVKMVVLPIAAVWLVARLLEAFGNRQNVDARVAPLAGLALSCAVPMSNFHAGALGIRDPRINHRRRVYWLSDRGDGLRPALLDPQPNDG